MKGETNDARSKQTRWSRLQDYLSPVLWQVFSAVVLLGIAVYLVAQYEMETFQPFELAAVTGLLGGFPLLAAFGDKVDDDGLRSKLKAIGGLYLFAAIFFVIFGFYQAADQAGLIPQAGAGAWLFKVIYAVTFLGATIALTLGMWMTLGIIPRLVGLRGVIERIKKQFRGEK